MTASSNAAASDLRISSYPQIDQTKYPDIYDDLLKVHSAIKLLQSYLDNFTGSRIVGKAHVTIAQGQFVAVSNNYSDLAGFHLAANGAYTDPCIGFALGGSSVGQGIEIQTMGIWPYGNGSLTPGSVYYLGVSGSITVTPPAGAGKLLQVVGFAIDTSNLLFRPAFKYKEL